MELLLVGLAVCFNIVIILWKFSRNRTGDAILDASLLALVAYVFSGSFPALVVGTIASAGVSIYLLLTGARDATT